MEVELDFFKLFFSRFEKEGEEENSSYFDIIAEVKEDMDEFIKKFNIPLSLLLKNPLRFLETIIKAFPTTELMPEIEENIIDIWKLDKQTMAWEKLSNIEPEI